MSRLPLLRVHGSKTQTESKCVVQMPSIMDVITEDGLVSIALTLFHVSKVLGCPVQICQVLSKLMSSCCQTEGLGVVQPGEKALWGPYWSLSILKRGQ